MYTVAACSYFAPALNVLHLVAFFLFTVVATCLEDARRIHMILRKPVILLQILLFTLSALHSRPGLSLLANGAAL